MSVGSNERLYYLVEQICNHIATYRKEKRIKQTITKPDEKYEIKFSLRTIWVKIKMIERTAELLAAIARKVLITSDVISSFKSVDREIRRKPSPEVDSCTRCLGCASNLLNIVSVVQFEAECVRITTQRM